MNKKDLKNSISLLGPASVGKSLLSKELSKKTGIPVINIDDLLVYINYHAENILTPDKKSQEDYKNRIIFDMRFDDNEYLYTSPKYIGKTSELIDDFLTDYNNYINILGDLTPLNQYLQEYYNFIDDNTDKTELFTIAFNKMVLNILEHIVSVAKCPVIFDLPAPFGFNVNEENFSSRTLIKIKPSSIL